MTGVRAAHSDPAAAVRDLLSVFGSDEANAAELLVDRHPPGQVAFTSVHVEPDGALRCDDLTYGRLADRSRRLASALAHMGIRRGDPVGVLLGKRTELVVALVAIARLGAVYLPLFTAFAPAAIAARLQASGARIVITQDDQIDKTTDLPGVTTICTGDHFDGLIASADPLEDSVTVGGDGGLALLFTSGTTGAPKGVPIPVRALAAFSCYMTYGLDVREADVYWNAADPGWAYGLYYGIVGPLATGRPNLLLSGGFSPEITARVLTDLRVTNFAAAPTVYRSLRKSGAVSGIRLRRASSAGEPLTPDVPEWSVGALGTEVRDHYGQTEHGMIINNHWHEDLRREAVPGSVGIPMPGFAAGIVDGRIAIDTPASPLVWFRGYLNDPDKTAERYTADGRWFLTGDAGRMDADGRFYFTGRDDDVIIMAGYRIGPAEVEGVLIGHPAVVDVAAVGVPDPLRGEVVEAFVVLAEGFGGDEALVSELQQLVKTELAAHAYPRRVHFVDALPKTPSGKTQRYLLRGR